MCCDMVWFGCYGSQQHSHHPSKLILNPPKYLLKCSGTVERQLPFTKLRCLPSSTAQHTNKRTNKPKANSTSFHTPYLFYNLNLNLTQFIFCYLHVLCHCMYTKKKFEHSTFNMASPFSSTVPSIRSHSSHRTMSHDPNSPKSPCNTSLPVLYSDTAPSTNDPGADHGTVDRRRHPQRGPLDYTHEGILFRSIGWHMQ